MAQEFITLGNTRVKLKNIKQYGISECERVIHYLKIYELNPNYIKNGVARFGVNYFTSLFHLYENAGNQLLGKKGEKHKVYDKYYWNGKKKKLSYSEYEKIKDYLSKNEHKSSSDTGYYDDGNDIVRILSFTSQIGEAVRQSNEAPVELMDETVDAHYLYITTYQNDNFQFVEEECGFDIFDKCKELDKLLNK